MVRSRLFGLVLLAAAVSSPGAAAETVLLDFTQASCAPCVEMEPVLQQLAAAERVRIQRVDVQRQEAIALQYKVEATPTYIVLVDGEEWARVSGVVQYDVMAEMLRKSQAMAAAARARAQQAQRAQQVQQPQAGIAPAAVSAVGYDVPAATHAAAAQQQLAAAGPMEGRVVPIRDPFAVRGPGSGAGGAANVGVGIGTAGAAGPGADPRFASVPASQLANHLIAATVRLSIADPNGKSTGTGAIVAARDGMALVLTCGHLFRESQGRGAVEISLFAAGPNGAELRGKAAGEVIDFDLERDLALVRFRTDGPVAVAPIAPAGTTLEQGAAVTSVGCNHGDNPTARFSQITSIDRYQGHPNVEAAGAPVEGRSGGGLFNAQGQLIGVCFASDPQGDEGLYAALGSIHAKLDELQLETVYQSPAATGPAAPQSAPATQLAAGPADGVVLRGQNPSAASTSTLPDMLPRAAGGTTAMGPVTAEAATLDPATLAGLSRDELATLEEIARRSGGAEVICIIRPQSPDGRSDVIKLSGVSPAFVRALTAAAANAGGAAASTAAAPGGVVR